MAGQILDQGCGNPTSNYVNFGVGQVTFFNLLVCGQAENIGKISKQKSVGYIIHGNKDVRMIHSGLRWSLISGKPQIHILCTSAFTTCDSQYNMRLFLHVFFLICFDAFMIIIMDQSVFINIILAPVQRLLTLMLLK